MKINYWACKFGDYDESYDSDGDLNRMYMCTHPCNPDRYCYPENKWGGDTDDCKFLDQKEEGDQSGN